MSEREIVDRFHELYYDSKERTWANTRWLGTPTQKCPLDLWVYQELLVKLRPDLIVETGTADGGSALYLASMCDLIGNGRIISIDIADPGGRPKHDRITYLLGSSVDPDHVATVQQAASEASCVLVILDSDHSERHVMDELHTYGPLVTLGSYMIVEDGNVNGRPVLLSHGPGPGEAIDVFLTETKAFEIDEECEKFFVTFNPRGYLRKVAPYIP